MDNYTVIKEEKKVDEEVTMTINDWYTNSNSCDYVMPVSESEVLSYTITKDKIEDPKSKFHKVDYTV